MYFGKPAVGSVCIFNWKNTEDRAEWYGRTVIIDDIDEYNLATIRDLNGNERLIHKNALRLKLGSPVAIHIPNMLDFLTYLNRNSPVKDWARFWFEYEASLIKQSNNKES